MLGQSIQTVLLERLGPEGVKQVFVWLQIGSVALILGGVIWIRSRPSQSGFAVREADLQARRRVKAGVGGKPLTSSQDLAQARIQKKAPLALPGIRIDGPPYEILGVSPTASAEEIQRAYRERMKQYHPDKVGSPGSREWQDAQKIAEAINRAKVEMLKNR